MCLCTVFETISSNTDEVFSSINPYANVLLFGDLNVNHNDWLSYSAGTDELVTSAVIFVIFDSRNSALSGFFSSDASIFDLQWLYFL